MYRLGILEKRLKTCSELVIMQIVFMQSTGLVALANDVVLAGHFSMVHTAHVV